MRTAAGRIWEEQKAVLAHDGKTGQIEKSDDVALRHPVRLFEGGAQAEAARQIEERLPQRVVVADNQPRVVMADAARPLQRRQNVDGVEEMADDDVIEGLVEVEVFRVGRQEVKLRIILFRQLDQPVADFDSHSVGRLNRSQQVSGLAADFQNPFQQVR